MLLDRYGNPLPVERVRPALGFVEKMVKADESETISGVTPASSTQLERDHEPGMGV